MEKAFECKRTTQPLFCDTELSSFFIFLERHEDCQSYDGKTKRSSMPLTIFASNASGIGRSLFLECNVCGKEEEITHHEHW